MASKKPTEPAPALVSVRISKAIRTRVKTYAAKTERDMQQVLDEALDEYLKKRGA